MTVFVCADCARWYGDDAIALETPATVQASVGPPTVRESVAMVPCGPSGGDSGTSLQREDVGVTRMVDARSVAPVGVDGGDRAHESSSFPSNFDQRGAARP